MPSYGNVFPPVSVGFGESAAVIASTDVIFPAPFKSAQVALAPGVISVQLQTADTDIDAAYANEGAAFSNLTAGNVTRAEFPDVVAKFARILIATLPNNVTATAKISA